MLVAPDAHAAQRARRFVTANNSAYDTLDPHVVFDIGRIGSRLNMYDCLVRWVDNPPKLQMWLADKIDIAPDGVTYTVAMKPGAKFHDGSPITADDVVFSMERILAMKQGAYGLFKGVIDPGQDQGARRAHRAVHAEPAVCGVQLDAVRTLGGQQQAAARARQVGRHGRRLAGAQRGGLRRIQAAPLRSGDRLPGRPVRRALRRLRQVQHHVDGIPRGAGNREPRARIAEGRVQHHRRLSAAGPDQAAAHGGQRADPGSGIAADDVFHHPQCAPAADRREPAQGAVLRVRLRRVHQQHPERIGRRECRHHSRQSVGRAEGSDRATPTTSPRRRSIWRW